MKPQLLRLCLPVILLIILSAKVSQAQITMTFPKAVTYVNIVPIGWATSSTPKSIRLIFVYKSGVETTVGNTWTLTLSSISSSGSFTFNPMTITSNSNFTSVSPNSVLPDGTWIVHMQYTRASDNVVFSSSSVTLVTSTHTLAPLLTSPVSSGSSTNPIAISYTLQGVPSLSNDSSQPRLVFTNSNITDTVKLSTSRVVSFNMNPTNVLSSSYVSSDTYNSLPDGLYTVILSYGDSYGHALSYDTTSNFLLQTVTPAPTLTSPSSPAANIVPVTFNLPSAPLANSVKLQFAGTDTVNLTLNINDSGNYSFNLNAADFPADTNVLTSSSTSLQLDTYNVTLSYQDFLGNPVASSVINNFSFEGVLPVTLINFDGKLHNNSVLLTWQTASEINNAGFEVQKQINGNWQKIGFIAGKGTTNIMQQYSFLDDSLLQGQINYYRLKQINTNGQAVFSNVLGVNNNSNTDNLSLNNYPNPFSTYTSINYNVPVAGHVTLDIFDASGKLITTLTDKIIPTGKYSINWNTQGLPLGVYYCKITTASFTTAEKMIKID